MSEVHLVNQLYQDGTALFYCCLLHDRWEIAQQRCDAVRTMLAVINYLETPVPQAAVRHIVEAGRLTGSAKNAQPWHFIVIENRDTLRQIGALARSGPYVAGAPLAITVAVEKTPFAVSDASRADADFRSCHSRTGHAKMVNDASL